MAQPLLLSPAAITQPIPGRRRQCEIEFEGKLFKRDIGMLIPQHTMHEIDPLTLNVTNIQLSNTKPKLYNKEYQLREDNLIICKTEITDTEWCLAEINRIYPEEIEITYYIQLQSHNWKTTILLPMSRN